MFHPRRGSGYGRALKVCGPCPVKTQCLDFALNNMLDDEDAPRGVGAWGMWGGTTPPERLALTGLWDAA